MAEEKTPPTNKVGLDLIVCDTIINLARIEIPAWRIILLALVCMVKYTFGAVIASNMILPISAYAPAWVTIPLAKPGPVVWGQEEESCNDTTQATLTYMEQTAAPDLPLAEIITATLLVLSGAGVMAAIYRFHNDGSSSHGQSADMGQEDIDVEVADVALAEENPVADIQEGAVMPLEIHLQGEEELVAVVQEEIGIMLNMRLHTILRKAPHLRTPLERLTADAWAEQRAPL